MATTITIPSTANNAVNVATTGAVSGDGTSLNPLAVNVDGSTIGVNGSNELEGLGAAVAFKTIAVAGQSNIVADAADDTLTIVAGSNITLTNNAGTDTLTIAAAGGGGGGTFAAWSSLTAYSAGDLAVDRGGTWQAVDSNTNSQPISGNAHWTLIGGTPYVDVVLTPTVITTAPFYDPMKSGPGMVVIPSPGAGYFVDIQKFSSSVDGGTPWGQAPSEDWLYGAANSTLLPHLFDASATENLTSDNEPQVDGNAVVNFRYGNNSGTQISTFLQGAIANLPITFSTDTDATDSGGGHNTKIGSRTLYIRVWYAIYPVTSVLDPVGPFFTITALVQGTKTFTVSDPDADLDGATGSLIVTGSTGNNGTYTIVSAVAGAGSTVIIVVEAIPSATADGWVNQ